MNKVQLFGDHNVRAVRQVRSAFCKILETKTDRMHSLK